MAERQKIPGANNDWSEWTILDFLNEDCWLAVLSHVPARDVMRTERASRRWQAVVLNYLRGIRIHILEEDDKRITLFNACCLNPSKYKSFESWTNKLGSSVVAYFCNNRESLKITRKCPNLETLELKQMHNYLLETFTHSLNLNVCKFLQGIHFYSCSVSDSCVSQFIGDKALKELKFTDCNVVTGECLSTLNTSNLKTLYFCGCRELNSNMLSAVERLNELTELKITGIDCGLAEEIQLKLHKMPKLERFKIISDIRTSYQYQPTESLMSLDPLEATECELFGG